jgi:peptidoglycan hydrolase CwlO-like protein
MKSENDSSRESIDFVTGSSKEVTPTEETLDVVVLQKSKLAVFLAGFALLIVIGAIALILLLREPGGLLKKNQALQLKVSELTESINDVQFKLQTLEKDLNTLDDRIDSLRTATDKVVFEIKTIEKSMKK